MLRKSIILDWQFDETSKVFLCTVYVLPILRFASASHRQARDIVHILSSVGGCVEEWTEWCVAKLWFLHRSASPCACPPDGISAWHWIRHLGELFTITELTGPFRIAIDYIDKSKKVWNKLHSNFYWNTQKLHFWAPYQWNVDYFV